MVQINNGTVSKIRCNNHFHRILHHLGLLLLHPLQMCDGEEVCRFEVVQFLLPLRSGDETILCYSITSSIVIMDSEVMCRFLQTFWQFLFSARGDYFLF